MFGREKEPEIVGAKEKIRRARALHEGRDPDAIESKREGRGGDDTTVTLVIIFGMSLVLALLLMQGPFAKGAPFHLPSPLLDRPLLGMPPPGIMGDRDIDMLIAIFLRGFVIFLLAGIVPLLVKAAARLTGRTPALVDFWTAGAAVLGFAFILMKF